MAIRELFVKILFDDSDSKQKIRDLNKDVDRASTEFKRLGVTGQASYAELAKATNMTTKEMDALVKKTKNEFKLDQQFRQIAREAGLAEDEINRIKSSIDKAKDSTASWKNAFSGLAAMGAISAFIGFSNKAIEESNKAENALIGFQTVVKNTLGIQAVDETTKGVEMLFQKLGGSMDISSIQMSVKNLLGAGFSASQALELVEKNAYMASVNRQSHYKTIGEAVQTYTEGIKNNNAMLTDSTGISENLSVTLKKVGLKMDDLNVESKRAAVLQAIHNFHTKEAGQYLDAYNSQMAGFQGQVIKANSAMTKILESSGDFLKKVLLPFIKIANPVLKFFSDAERGADRTSFAFTILTALMLSGLYNLALSYNIVSFAAIKAWAAMLGPALLVAAKLLLVYLILEDIWTFFEYGPEASDTYFGDIMRGLGVTEAELQKLFEGFQELKNVLSDFAGKVKLAFQNETFVKVVKWIFILIGAIVFFKIILITTIVMGLIYVVARWDQIWGRIRNTFLGFIDSIKTSFKNGVNYLVESFYSVKDKLIEIFNSIVDKITNLPFVQRFLAMFNNLKTKLSDTASGIWTSMKNMFTSLLPVDALNSMIDGINWMIKKLNEWSSGKIASTLGMSPLNLSIIPHLEKRELGGPINAYQPYLVGEKGPEIVVPRNSGTVIPNDKIQGATTGQNQNTNNTFNLNISLNSVSPEYDATTLYEKIMELVNSANSKAQARFELGVS